MLVKSCEQKLKKKEHVKLILWKRWAYPKPKTVRKSSKKSTSFVNFPVYFMFSSIARFMKVMNGLLNEFSRALSTDCENQILWQSPFYSLPFLSMRETNLRGVDYNYLKKNK